MHDKLHYHTRWRGLTLDDAQEQRLRTQRKREREELRQQWLSRTAYLLWERDGRPDSDGVYYWLQAEAQWSREQQAGYVAQKVGTVTQSDDGVRLYFQRATTGERMPRGLDL